VCVHSILFQSLQIGTTKKNDYVIDTRVKEGVKKEIDFCPKRCEERNSVPFSWNRTGRRR